MVRGMQQGRRHSRGVRSSSCRNAAVRGAPILPAGVVYLATSTRPGLWAKKRTVVELDEAALAAAQVRPHQGREAGRLGR